jgi:hypothetical protein
MFRLLMHLDFIKLLDKAISINVVCDGKQFGPQHAVGTVLCIYFRDESEEEKDAFGNSIAVYKVVRMPMSLQQAPNKIAVDVVKSNGEKYVQQSPFLCLRSLVLSFAHHIFKYFGHKLVFVLDAAADNRGCGNLQRSMDSLSGRRSMHECIMITRNVGSAVEADLKTDGMLDILTQFRAEIDLPQLTDNLRALRLGQRYLCEATSELKRLRKEEKAKSKAETASTAQASQASSSPATACSDANLEGGQGTALPAQPSPATTGPTNAQCLPIPLAALMENVERAELEVEKAKAALEAVERAQLAVEKAKANLAADCAASLAKHGVESSLGMGVRERPLELNVNGPVMRRPADVRRFFDLYEKKWLEPFLKRERRTRWVARRWYCLTQDRAVARRATEAAAKVLACINRRAMPQRDCNFAQGYWLAQRANPAQPAPAGESEDDPEKKKKWKIKGIYRAEEVERRVRNLRKLKYELWGRALYRSDDPGDDGVAGDDQPRVLPRDYWKTCHLVVNANGQVSFNRPGLKSMFERKRGQLGIDSVSTVVSMRQNPARFWPCRDQRVSYSSTDSAANSAGSSHGQAGAVADPPPTEVCHVGHAQQCSYHSEHNAVNDFTKLLDMEVMHRVVSTIKTVKNPFVEPEMRAAIDYLFSEDPEVRAKIDSETEFFKLTRERIEAQAARGKGISLKEAREEMGVDVDEEEFSAESAHTCAIVRWATVGKSATWLIGWRRAVSFGLLQIGGLGLTVEDEINAAVAIFSHQGFVSAQHQHVRLEAKVAEAFEFLVRSTTITQLAIVRFVHIIVLQPLMQCMGENNECSERMMGMDSVPRRLLYVLSREIFVSTGEWAVISRIGHRSHGAEFQVPDKVWRQGCVRLLCGQRCASKIRQRLGNDWGEWGIRHLDKMANAGPELLKIFGVLAAKEDNVLPQMAESVFEIAYSKEKQLYGATNDATRNSSYALRMLQLQMLAGEVMHNVVKKLAITFRVDLFGAKGFMSGMYRSQKTVGKVSCPETGRRVGVVYPHGMAGANAVITLLMGQEINSHFTAQIRRLRVPLYGKTESERVLDFFPAFAGELWSKAGADGIRNFLGISDWHRGADNEGIARWGQHHNQFGELIQLEVESATHPPPVQMQWNWRSELPRPLQQYPAVFKWAELAAKLSASGKPIEGCWSGPAEIFEGRGQMGAASLNNVFTSCGHRCSGMDPASIAINDVRVRAAAELGQYHGWERVLTVDKVMRNVMAKDYVAPDAAAAAREGAWSKTRHGGEYRRTIYADPTGKRLTTTTNSRAKLVEDIRRRLAGIDPSAGVTKRSNRRSISSNVVRKPCPRKPYQPRPRKPCPPRPRKPYQPRKARLSRAGLAGAESADAAGGPLDAMSTAGRSVAAVAGPRRKTHNRAQRQSTGQGGDEDDWTPAPRDKTLAVQAADTEKRCTRRNAREKHLPAGSPTRLPVPVSAAAAASELDSEAAAVAGPDRGLHPGCGSCGAVSEASSAPECIREISGINSAAHGDVGADAAAPVAAEENAVASLAAIPDDSLACTAADGGVGAAAAAPVAAEADADAESDMDDLPLAERRELGRAGTSSRNACPAIPDDSLACTAAEGCSAEPVPAAEAAPASYQGKSSKGGARESSGSGGRRGARKVGRARTRPSSKGAAGTVHGNNDSDDDDMPLFPVRVSALNSAQTEKVTLNENPWSIDFAIACSNLAWYGNPNNPSPVWLMKEPKTAVYGKEGDAGNSSEVTITRRASPYLEKLLSLKGCTVHPGISFVVRAKSMVYYYLMFDSYAGACLVTVDKIMARDQDDWSETMSYRRVFTTKESATQSKHKNDTGMNRGNAYFRALLLKEEQTAEEEDSSEQNSGEPFTTYHVGDVYYKGDIRTLVGVVRWKNEARHTLPDDYFKEYLQADLVNTGAGVVQNTAPAKGRPGR